MHLRDILRRKGTEVHTVSPDVTVQDAIAAMNRHRVGAVVVTADDSVVGIISERDVLRMYGEADPAEEDTTGAGAREPRNVRVADLMTKDVIIALPTDTIDYAMGVMTQNRIRHLPIIEDGRLAGIVSIGDVVREHLSEAQYENRLLRSYIQGTVYY